MGQIVAVVVENKDDIAAFANYTPPAPKGAKAKPAEPAAKPAPQSAAKSKPEPGNFFIHN